MNTPTFYVPTQCRQDSQPRFIVNMKKGAFYMLTDKGDYKPVECYLPAASYKTPEQYADDRCERLLTGVLTIRNALGASGYPLTARYQWNGSELVTTNDFSRLTSLHKVVA
ncbi:hypothetical protein [Enterobacter mori]